MCGAPSKRWCSQGKKPGTDGYCGFDSAAGSVHSMCWLRNGVSLEACSIDGTNVVRCGCTVEPGSNPDTAGCGLQFEGIHGKPSEQPTYVQVNQRGSIPNLPYLVLERMQELESDLQCQIPGQLTPYSAPWPCWYLLSTMDSSS